MANTRWIGGAQARAQITTIQITAYDAATSYTLTCGSKTVTTIAAGSVNATATALAAAWDASEEPEMGDADASASTDTVTLTGTESGRPFTVSSSVSGGTGTIGAATTTTSATGPNHWDNATNWDTGAVPVNSDDVFFDNNDDDVKYGLAQSAVTLTSLTIAASFTGTIGLPEVNADGSAEYHEYRDQYLTIKATTVTIGQGPGDGSGRIKWNASTVQTTLNVHGTASGLETNLPALIWKGTHASNVVNVFKGSFGAAVFGGEAATILTLRSGYVSSQQGDVDIRLGAGCTLTTVEVHGGTVETNSALTTLTVYGGEVTHNAGAVTTVTIEAGTVYYRGTATITTLIVGSGGTADFTRDQRARTVSACDIYGGATVLDTNKSVTWSAGIDLNRCSLADVTLQVGDHVRLTPGTPA